MSIKPRDYGYYDDDDSNGFKFFDSTWSAWNVIPGTPSTGAGRNGYKPGKEEVNPIDQYNFSDKEREAFTKVRRWGEGPVMAAAEELGYDQVNDIDSLYAINDWLKENYGDLFDEDEDDDKKEPFVPTVYEPKELDMGDYSATPVTPKVNARMRIGGQPRAANKMKITGTSGY